MSTGDPICPVCGNYKIQCTCATTLSNLMNLNELKYKAARVSDEKFGRTNPVSAPILKLIEEIGEVLDCLKNGTDPQVEFADCFLLLVDAYRKYYGDNVDMQTLIDVSSEKLDVIARRKWGKPNEHGVYKHILETEEKKKIYQFLIINKDGTQLITNVECSDWSHAQKVKDEYMRSAKISTIDIIGLTESPGPVIPEDRIIKDNHKKRNPNTI